MRLDAFKFFRRELDLASSLAQKQSQGVCNGSKFLCRLARAIRRGGFFTRRKRCADRATSSSHLATSTAQTRRIENCRWENCPRFSPRICQRRRRAGFSGGGSANRRGRG